MKKIVALTLITAALTLAVSLSTQSFSFAKSINIPSDIAYILIDSKTGQVMAEQNADQKLHPASTTKIMTAIIALEKGDLRKEAAVSPQAVADIGRNGMNIGIMAGEKGLTLENMLSVMLIKSANETANIIAENVAPSRSEFVEMMNRKAKELGALNTTFRNPCGKDTDKEDEGHLTTARDLAVIARYAMAIPKFREIVSTEYYKNMPATDKHNDWGILRNTNQLLWYDNKYPYVLDNAQYKYAVNGIKTGYTAAAGNNLVASAVGEDGMELISVVMHVMQPNKIYGYSKELLRYGFENYSMRKICSAGQILASVTVNGAKDGPISIGLATSADVAAALPLDADVGIPEKRINIAETVKAPVKKGDILGSVEYISKGVLIGKTNLVASQSVEADPAASVSQDAGKANSSASGKDSGSSYSYLLLGILVFLSILSIVRMILRRASRNLRKKRWNRKYYDSREYD